MCQTEKTWTNCTLQEVEVKLRMVSSLAIPCCYTLFMDFDSETLKWRELHSSQHNRYGKLNKGYVVCKI